MIIHSLLIMIIFKIVCCYEVGLAYNDCGSEYKLQSVDLNCTHPCVLEIGKTYPVSLKFHSTFQADQLEQNAVIYLHKVHFKVNVNPVDPCVSLISCPIRPLEYETIRINLNVRKNLLPGSGELQWEMKTGKKTAVCFRAPVQLEKQKKILKIKKQIRKTAKIMNELASL